MSVLCYVCCFEDYSSVVDYGSVITENLGKCSPASNSSQPPYHRRLGIPM